MSEDTQKAKAKAKKKPVKKPAKKKTFKQIHAECKAAARVGRPSKYRPEFPEMMYEYFDVKPSEEKKIYDNRGELIMARVAVDFPTMSGFAAYIGVTSSTMRDWATKNTDGVYKYPEFSATYQLAKEFQDNIIVANTLNGSYKENFAKFISTNILGYKDKQVTDVNVSAVGVGTIDTETSTKDAADIYQANCND